MPAILGGIWAAIKLAPAFLSSVWNLLLISIEIAKWIRSTYERHERAKITEELKQAVRESRQTLDNSKLMDLLQKKKDGSNARGS